MKKLFMVGLAVLVLLSALSWTVTTYLAGQGGDKAEAKARFVKLDGDKDGFVSREEFISSGKKK